jgi:hypothetical protein
VRRLTPTTVLCNVGFDATTAGTPYSRDNSPSFRSRSSSFKQAVVEKRIAPTDIIGLETQDNLLGEGGFGVVRKVLWRHTPAAAKVAHEAEMSQHEKMLFLRELEVMSRVRHPNIVQFLGYVESPFVILLELCPGGDLRHYWQTRQLSAKRKLEICVCVCRALAYLHNRKPSSVIHRDVKPTNVPSPQRHARAPTSAGADTRRMSLSRRFSSPRAAWRRSPTLGLGGCAATIHRRPARRRR